MRSGFATTMLVIVHALFPAGRHGHLSGNAAGSAPPGYTRVPREDIAVYLAELDRAVGNDGKLSLFFPGCTAVAAPFLLFRLKREGYSACRATATGDGLLVDARR